MSGVLVAAATRWESEPIRRALGSCPVTVLRTGMGPAAAAAALARLETEPALIVSAGFAGALREDLRCAVWETASYPKVCRGFKPVADACGSSRKEALALLEAMERDTRPGRKDAPGAQAAGGV